MEAKNDLKFEKSEKQFEQMPRGKGPSLQT